MKYIIRLLIFIISVSTFTSCMTERKCYEKYPIPVINKDSIIYKDSIINIYIYDTLIIKGDTTLIDTNTNIINGIVNSPNLIRETEFAIATAQVRNSRLYLQLRQKDSIIQRLLKPKIKIVTKDVWHTKTITKKVWIKHWYSDITLYISIVVTAAFIILLVIKILKLIYTL